ncbi:hypothetical protein ACWGI1_07570 [Streptomyces sp. NPDC054835]|uniref:hypothetical protein n=1 Tax=Streptomyces sp. NBC_01268 TaxID=2903806 RepID=UPI002E363C2A|nr:hypothetical protein [Streptomyces sp. NBC_01268]
MTAGVAVTANSAPRHEERRQEIRKVVYLLGDSMGRTHVTAARERCYGATGKLNKERLPNYGAVATYAVEKDSDRPALVTEGEKGGRHERRAAGAGIDFSVCARDLGGTPAAAVLSVPVLVNEWPQGLLDLPVRTAVQPSDDVRRPFVRARTNEARTWRGADDFRRRHWRCWSS